MITSKTIRSLIAYFMILRVLAVVLLAGNIVGNLVCCSSELGSTIPARVLSWLNLLLPISEIEEGNECVRYEATYRGNELLHKIHE